MTSRYVNFSFGGPDDEGADVTNLYESDENIGSSDLSCQNEMRLVELVLRILGEKDTSIIKQRSNGN